MPYHRCPACGLTGYIAGAHSSARACPNCSAPLAEGSKLYLVPGPRRELRCTLVARPQAATDARHALLGLAVTQTTRDKLALLVSELVTNAVLHAGLSDGDDVELHVTSNAGLARLAVHDRGHGFDPSGLGQDHEPPVIGGQGRVEGCCGGGQLGCEGRHRRKRGGQRLRARVDIGPRSRGHIDCRPDGCTVWCEIASEEEPDAALEGDPATGDVHELGIQMARTV